MFKAIAPIVGLPHRGYLSTQGKTAEMPVINIVGKRDATEKAGMWDATAYTRTRMGSSQLYTGATAIIRSWGEDNSCPYTGEIA